MRLATTPRALVLSVFAPVLILIAAAAASADIVHTTTFDASSVRLETREGFDVVRVDGCRFEREAGMPMVPVRTVHLSVPAGMRAAGLEVRAVERVEIGTGYLLYPGQPPVRLSSEEVPEFVDPDPGVYGADAAYPGVDARLVSNGLVSGYSVVGLHVYPISYEPLSGRVLFNKRIEIALVLEPSAEPARTISARTASGERAIADRVRALVANPKQVIENAGPRDAGRQETVEYAIVTGSSYVDEFQPLADWKTKKGVPAEIFTTTWIYSSYTGTDNQEKIRNFIKDYETNHGLVYVLLGGDVDVVPARIAWDDLGYDQIRADLYYSDTDGSWNADGDSYWGEYPADAPDMYGDVYVGRAPVNTSLEASVFVDKVLTYEGADAGSTLPTDFQEEMLFLAEVLWGPPNYEYTDGGVMKDMIDDESVPSNFDPITKLYEDDGNLNYSSAMAALNAGPGITNHAGHCNYNVMSIGPSALYNSDMDALTNGTRQGIYYTMGCYAAAFDYDNIAEHYVNNPNGGGAAFVGNSRYGWACPGYPGECASDLFDREFFRSLFNENLYTLGIAHTDARDYFVPDAQADEYMRYCHYELNVLGDPEMPIWTSEPAVLSASHPSELPSGASSFVVTATSAGAPVAGARVCLWKGTEVYAVAMTNSSGQASFEPEPSTGGTMSVTAIARNHLPYEGTATVTEGTPPSKPTGLAATGGDAEVSLAWNANPEPDIDYYVLYRGTAPSPTDSLATIDFPGTGYLDTDVVNDTTYYYRLRAVDAEGERSPLSDEASAMPQQPPVIFITHTPLEDTEDANVPYPVVAVATSTEAPLDPDSILVLFQTESRAWSSLLMTPTGTPDEYRALIPAQPCGTRIDYYILAVDENHNRETHPDFAPAAYHSFSVDFAIVFEDDFEADRGWTVGAADDDATTGIWERCDPQATEAQPEDDHTPAPGTHAYITQCAAGSGQGSYDVDGGKTTLFSPVFDLSGYSSAVASYYRWYSNNTGSNPGTDYWVVQVTDDGWSTWSVLENTNTTNRSWVRMQFDLGSHVELNDQVQFRFIASDEGSGSIVEAGVDDFAIGGCLLPSDTIAPTVLLIAPNGGEYVVGSGGDPTLIRWTSNDNVAVVETRILLSTDGGASYPDTLATGALDSTWSWDAPDQDHSHCRIKVVCFDAAGNSAADESDADFSIVTETGVAGAAVPARLVLSENRPNPFNPSTRIDFGLPRAGRATLEIYSVLGERVAILADGVYGAGYHSVAWPGTNARGTEVASGVYFYRLVADGRVLTRKMLLLK
jgi:hypothetical protein